MINSIHNLFSKKLIVVFLISICTVNLNAQLSGTKTIPADYVSIAAFVTDLNAVGVGPGGVTLSVSAGYTETAPAGGYKITASGTVTDQIVIMGMGLPLPLITASPALTVGALNDAIFVLHGADAVTIQGLQMQENPANTITTAGTNNMTEWGVALIYFNTTNGAQNNSIKDNTISLNRFYQNTFGIYSNSTHTLTSISASVPATSPLGNNSGLRIYGNSISNVNNGICIVGPTAAANHNDGIDIGGTLLSEGNILSNYGTTGTFSNYVNVSGTVNGILIRNTKNFNVSNNSITSSVGGTTTASLRGIFVINFSTPPTGTFTNSINGNTLNIISGSATGVADGIIIQSTTGTATSSISVDNNLFTGLGHSVASTGIITFISQLSPMLNASVSSNSFNSLTSISSGNVTFIAANYFMPAGGSQVVNNNQLVGGFNKLTAGGTVILFGTYGVSPIGTTHTSDGNNFSGITLTGATALIGWDNSDDGGVTKNITNNIFSSWVGGTLPITVIIQDGGDDNCNVSNNAISSITSQSTITGINLGNNNIANSQTCSNNSITGLTSTGTGGNVTAILNNATLVSNLNINGNTITNLSTSANAGTCIGISNATANTLNIFENTISGLSASGTTPVISGILTSGTVGTFNVYQNKIYSLNASGPITNTAINALSFQGGLNVNAYNNVISGLTAPAGNANNVINGIVVNSTVLLATYKVYYNSLYMNATSSGANFGTTGIFHTISVTATTGALDLRNNIIINESVPNGTGLTVAYRRSGLSLSNYSMSSNNNLFYVGIPSASNVIFTNGTTPQSTLFGYQTVVAPRDINSFTGEAFTYSTPGSFFISLTGSSSDFLRPVAAITTLVEGGAEQISSPLIADDYDGTIRAGNIGYLGTGLLPDLGAYEFEGTTLAPVISLNSVTPGTTAQCSTTSRLVSVNVTTLSGTITGATLYYAFNGAPQGPITMVNTSGTTWEATIPVATPVNATVSWSVVADNSIPLSSAYLGTNYSDEPLFGFIASVSASPTTVCSGGMSSLSVTLSNPAAAPSYIAPPAVTNPMAEEDLGNITITQGVTPVLNNTSAMNSLTGTIGVATGTIGSYSDFTAFGPYTMTPGLTYNFSISSLQDVTPFNNALAIYIDYNRNGLFTDAGEQAYSSSSLTLGAHTETGSFLVPGAAMSGVTRMRIISNETTLITSPTQTVANGEYEEYTINILSVISSVTWSDGFGTVGTGNPLVVATTAMTTYSADITSAGCLFSPDPTTVVNVNALPSAPTATNSAQCVAQVPTASVASTTGAITPVFNWYDAAVAGVLVQSSTSTTNTSNVSSTTTFYVSEVDGVTFCESALTPVTVTVAPADAVVATASFATICIGNSVDLTASNTNPFPLQNYTYTWSGIVGSGADVPVVGAVVTILPTAPGTYTYDLSAVDGGCNAIDQVVVTVDAFDISVSPIDITCFGLNDGTFSIGLATCGTMPYSYSIDGGLFGALPTNLSAGTYNVVVKDNNGYVTAGQMITIVEPTILISDPVATDIIICQDDFSAMVIATATTNIPSPATISWWDNSTAGSQLGTGSPFDANVTTVLPTTTPGTYTVYAQGQDGVCSSTNRTPINITVLPSSFSNVVAAQCAPYILNSTTYLSSGTFTQTLVNSIGCDSIITIDLTIYPTSTSTTTVTTCDSYDWTDGNTYLFGGTYTQALVNYLGCDSIATLDLTLGTTPIATATDNGDGTITASTGVTYAWLDCVTGLLIPGETGQTINLTANGSYASVVYSLSICSDTSACVNINYIGIDESATSVFNLFPNPTKDHITITMNTNSATVEVFDAQGKLLEVVIIENNGQIDLSNYERGIYCLKIKTEKDSSTHRIVKQ